MARRYETLAAASDRTGISVKTLRRYIGNGVLQGFRCGRLLRVDPTDVDGLFRPIVAGSRRGTGLRSLGSSAR